MVKLIINFIYGCFAILFISIIILSFNCDAENTAKNRDNDTLNHPVYSQYEFSKLKNIINIGVQPLWVPTSLISETMKRDMTLKKRLEELSMRIHWFSFLKGDDLNVFLINGSLHGGIGGDMPAINAASKMKIIVPVLTQQGFISIVAERQMPVTELRGKRIGYASGSNAHYALLNILHHAGLNEKDVKLVALDISAMPEALENGKIDAFSAWEPTPTLSVKYTSNAVKIYKSLSSGYLYFSNTFVENNREVTNHIVAAEIRAIFWMQKSHENLMMACEWALQEGGHFMDKPLNLTLNELAELAKDDLIGTGSLPIIPENDLMENGALHKEFLFLKELGKISATVEWAMVRKSFNSTIINNIITNRGNYSLREFNYE